MCAGVRGTPKFNHTSICTIVEYVRMNICHDWYAPVKGSYKPSTTNQQAEFSVACRSLSKPGLRHPSSRSCCLVGVLLPLFGENYAVLLTLVAASRLQSYVHWRSAIYS